MLAGGNDAEPACADDHVGAAAVAANATDDAAVRAGNEAATNAAAGGETETAGSAAGRALRAAGWKGAAATDDTVKGGRGRRLLARLDHLERLPRWQRCIGLRL